MIWDQVLLNRALGARAHLVVAPEVPRDFILDEVGRAIERLLEPLVIHRDDVRIEFGERDENTLQTPVDARWLPRNRPAHCQTSTGVLYLSSVRIAPEPLRVVPPQTDSTEFFTTDAPYPSVVRLDQSEVLTAVGWSENTRTWKYAA